MCDQELITAIPEELGYFDERKEEDKKVEVHERETSEDSLKNSGGEQK